MLSPTPVRHNSAGSFRPDIEGLRGIAVLLVVMFHCGVPGFWGGFIGVDIFFALSGYLITGLIVKEIEKNGKLSFKNFYARRARRLLPASGLVVVSILVLSLAVYSPLELASYSKWASYTSLYISNYMFMHDAVNYFASDVTTNPYLHTWSLAVEEQFYLFWPALIALALTRSKSRRSLAAVLLVMCVVSFGLCIWLTHRKQPWAFFGLPTRAWEFGLGGLACLLTKTKLTAWRSWMEPLGWGGLAAVLVAGYFYSPEMAFPGYPAFVPVAGTIAALIAGASGVSYALQAVLGSPPLQYFGKLSYSWYLWHWPILLFAAVLFPNLTWHGRLLAAALALVFAQISFVVVERPIRFNPFLMARPGLSLCLALIIPLAGITCAQLVAHKTQRALASGEQAGFLAASQDPRPLFEANCLTRSGMKKVSECEYGDRGSSTTAVLFGDSHAEHWFPALESIATQEHWRLVTLLKSSCPAARVEVYNSTLKRPDTECTAWREAALLRIVQMHPHVVVLSQKDGAVSDLPVPGRRHSPISGKEWQKGLRSTLSFLDTHGVKTVVIADVPRAEFDVPICLSRAAAHSWGARECLVPRSAALNEDARQAESIATEGLNGVRYADFADKFCSGSLCQPVIAGQVVYRDSNHMTSSFARGLAPYLEGEVASLVGK
jgi:peptidoglycan/LPS O-acetylase OafA/YrhL